MKIIHIVLMSLFLAACQNVPTQATDQGSVIQTKPDGTKTENLSDYAIYAKSAGEKQPIFEMSCPDAGCVFKTLKVNAPQGKNDIAPPVPVETAGVAFTKGFFGLAHDVIGLGPWYFGSKVLTKAFDTANASVSTITTNTDSSNRSVVNDSSNRSTTTTTTTTTNTDNSNRSINNSNNRNCQTGNGASGGAGTTTGGAGGPSGQATC